MSLKCPKEGPVHPTMPPSPITAEQLTAIMAEAPPAPLSPRSIETTIANYLELTTDMLHTVVHRLIATLCKRDIEGFAERNKVATRIHKLEDQISKELQALYDLHNCPDGFEANDKNRALNAHIPDKDGYLVMPKWVRYLEDGRIAAYAMGAPIDSFLYITEVYAEPSINEDNELFEPMPHWFRATMHANESHWQVLYKEVFKLAH